MWLAHSILCADLGDHTGELLGLPPEQSGGFVILSFGCRGFRLALIEILAGYAINFRRGSEIHDSRGPLFRGDRKTSFRKPKSQPQQSPGIISESSIHEPRVQAVRRNASSLQSTRKFPRKQDVA